MLRSLMMAVCSLLLAAAFLAVAVGPALYRAWPAIVALRSVAR
jgi:hypothetical protein